MFPTPTAAAAAASIRRAAFFAPSSLSPHTRGREGEPHKRFRASISNYASRPRGGGVSRHYITHSYYGNLSAGHPTCVAQFHLSDINLPLPLNIQWAEYLFPQSYTESESQRRRSETDLLLLAVTVLLLLVVLVFREICGAGEE